MLLTMAGFIFALLLGMIAGVKATIKLKLAVGGFLYALAGILLFGWAAYFMDLGDSHLGSMRDWLIAAFYLAAFAAVFLGGAIAGRFISQR